ncbi:hypothetical protein DPV73_09845 [Leptospira mayottensis]|nr:hypothetical protein DPV73_09845 [Leptospira mayottensis]
MISLFQKVRRRDLLKKTINSVLDIIFENFYTFTKSTVNFGYYLHASIIQLLPRLKEHKSNH